MLMDIMSRPDPLAEPLEVTQFVAEVGTRIRLMRLARGMSQADLAARSDISRQTLIGIESGLQHSLASAAQDPA